MSLILTRTRFDLLEAAIEERIDTGLENRSAHSMMDFSENQSNYRNWVHAVEQTSDLSKPMNTNTPGRESLLE